MATDDNSNETRADWFTVTRAVFDHPMLAGEFDRRSAWLWMVANAAWKDHKVRTRGGMVELKHGDVLVARDHIATVLRWTPKRVRIFQDQIEAAGMISRGQSKGHFATVARIENYERWQAVGTDHGPTKGPTEGLREASEGPHRKEVGATRSALQGVADRAVIDTAHRDFNRAAETVGSSRCTSLTDARAATLAKRLRDLGQGDLDAGTRRFRDALSAIPHWPFLAGRERPRDGRSPFKLDLERLLTTGSGMGDVLAKLCDLFDEHGPANASAAPGQAAHATSRERADAAWREAQAEELAEQRARRETLAGFDAVH